MLSNIVREALNQLDLDTIDNEALIAYSIRMIKLNSTQSTFYTQAKRSQNASK
jgi:hypothetical protein